MKVHRLFLCLSFFLAACGNPIAQLKTQLKKDGYILYQTPLAEAGTGTLLGGAPSSMSIIAGPDTCFPEQMNGTSTQIRKTDAAAIANYSKTVSFAGNAAVDLSKFMQTGNPLFNIGAGIDSSTTIELQFGGVQVEYLDSVLLESYYNTQMSGECKAMLNSAGFIIQALRVDKMQYAFNRVGNGYIQLTLDNVSQYFNIDANAKYHIEQNYLLTFDTPKYIGYQLGRLQTADKGISLERASTVVLNQYVFKSLSLFGN